MSWMLLWKVMFVVVMLVFSVMALLVTVLGARDIKKLLKALEEKGEEPNDGLGKLEKKEDLNGE